MKWSTLSNWGTTGANVLISGSFRNLVTVGLIVESCAGATTISAPIALGGSQQWINTSGNTLTATGGVALGANQLTISGTGSTTIQSAVSGACGLIKAGNGSFTTADYVDLNLLSVWSIDTSNLSSLGTVSVIGVVPAPSCELLLRVGLWLGVLRRSRNRP